MTNLDKPIAIHHRADSFSEEWVKYCDANNVPYLLVDCYRTDIVDVVSKCAGLMWHWSHSDASAAKFARQLTYSLEQKGIPVFPNTLTSWHYDDKLGQKYLFEALDIPHVPSYAFYRKTEAINFVRQSSLPLVFKLTRGAGSQNVVLVNNLKQGKSIIRRSFGRGWRDRTRGHALDEVIWHLRKGAIRQNATDLLKNLALLVYTPPGLRNQRIEAAYAYFQDFIPNNDSDVRIVVIGEKAFGFRRMVRDGDFRASGSGTVDLDPEGIPQECVKIAFESAEKMGLQSAAFDFVFDKGEPLVVEVSYAFSAQGVTRSLPGYWSRELSWHDGEVNAGVMIIEQFLSGLRKGSHPGHS